MPGLFMTVLLGVGLYAPRAQAQEVGHWELFKMEYEGENRAKTENNPDYAEQWTQDRGFQLGLNPGNVQPNGVSGSIKIAGRVRPTFHWVAPQILAPDGFNYIPDPNSHPTGKLRYIFTARAEGLANSSNQYWDPSANDRDRVLSKEHVSVEILGQSIQGKDTGYSTEAKVEIDKPVVLDPQSMTSDNLLVGPWLGLSVEASVDGNRYGNGSYSSSVPGAAAARLSLSSAPDDQKIIVLRVGAPAAKAENDPTLDKSHDEWTDSEGYGHGHSRWSYSEYGDFGSPSGSSPYSTQSRPITQSFIASPTGTNWSPYSQLSGRWSPSDSRDQVPPSSTPGAVHLHVQDMLDGGGLLSTIPEGATQDKDLETGWHKEPKKGEQEVTYVLRDTVKGKQGSGQYFLTLHNEWDNGRPGPLPNKVYNTEYPIKTNGAVTWYHDEQTHKFSGKVSHTWKITGGIKLKTSNLFGIIPEAEGSIGGEYGGTKEYAVESTTSQTTAPFKHRYFYVNIHEEQKQYLIDHFGPNGFLGSEDVWLPYNRAAAYEAGFSHEYDETDFDTRDHHGVNDLVDQNADYKELETPQP